ncbi:MAG: ABC transporter ATP-binding protein [Candidatus Promineifilaceae bacterium]|nr:ABC transporter ATP-binding protein [Candidatus Promineifilaceae bacterium]
MPVTHPIPKDSSPTLVPDKPLVEVTDLSFSYDNNSPVLHKISFSIRDGEKVALIGPNGAGKSTLMLHLNGLLAPDGNQIRIAGMPLNRQNLPLVRSQVGLVFQNPDDQLFSPTVFEDVAFGPLHMGYGAEEVQKRAQYALQLVGMADLADRMPHHLSVGQKKRVSIATVLSMSPRILVLDEPTAGLDPRGRRLLISLLRELPISMLVSTHDMHLVAELFPRLIILDEGKMVVDGLTAELLPNRELLEAHGLESPDK